MKPPCTALEEVNTIVAVFPSVTVILEGTIEVVSVSRMVPVPGGQGKRRSRNGSTTNRRCNYYCFIYLYDGIIRESRESVKVSEADVKTWVVEAPTV